MRIIGRFPDQRQVGAFVDSAKSYGFERKDMIISDLAKEQHWSSIEEASEEITFLKTDRSSPSELVAFAEDIKGFDRDTGLVVSVKIPKHSSDRVRKLMEQNGAVEILQD